MYKLGIAKLIYKVYNNITPPSMSHIIVKHYLKHGLRNSNNKVVAPRFKTDIMRHSVAYRDSVIWNALVP